MGPPADLNLEYRSSGKKKNGGFVRNEFVSTEKWGLEERLRCLEEERKKIDAFKRELPLCMQLVNDAIESVRRQMKQQSGNTLPVLEEFIPIKILSQEEERKEDGLMTKEKDYKERLNWMRSAQLWIDNHDDLDLRKERAEAESFPSENSHSLSVNPDRESIVQLKGGSALFKEEDVSPDLFLSTESKLSSRAPSSSPEQSATQTQRKARRCWSPELHRRFVNALHQLGGAQVATPKQIRESMKVDGLTNDEVKSHLQKYRLHTRRTGAVHSLAGGPHGNSLALMGGIWMSQEFPSSRGTRGLKQSSAQSGSPQGPLQLSVNQRTSNGNLEEDEEDDDEETKSESYSWRGAQQRSGSIGVTESS